MSQLTLPTQTTAISTLGFNAKRLRMQNGMTQQCLAEALLGLPGNEGKTASSLRVQIATIENGRAPTGSAMNWLDWFAAAFDVSFHELLSEPTDD